MSTCAVTNIINCISSFVVDDFDMFCTHFHPSELMMDNLNDRILTLNSATFETCISFRGLCPMHGINTKCCL